MVHAENTSEKEAISRATKLKAVEGFNQVEMFKKKCYKIMCRRDNSKRLGETGKNLEGRILHSDCLTRACTPDPTAWIPTLQPGAPGRTVWPGQRDDRALLSSTRAVLEQTTGKMNGRVMGFHEKIMLGSMFYDAVFSLTFPSGFSSPYLHSQPQFLLPSDKVTLVNGFPLPQHGK